MAPLNPQVPGVQAPQWTNVTQPVSVEGNKVADKSTGLLLDTIGTGITDATNIIDTTIKDDIKNQAQTGTDKLRDAYTESLVAMRNIQIGQQQGQGSLLPDSSTNAPANLDAGLNRVKQLGVAMAQNSGKVNDTLYTGALNSMAKQLRAQYPGYRDYIDEQIKSVSGVDPANAFMKNLQEDINRNQEQNKTALNETLSSLKSAASSGVHDANGIDAAQIWGLVKNGQLAPEKGLSWLNSTQKLKYDLDVKQQLRQSRQNDEADTDVSNSKDLSTTAGSMMQHNWDTMTLPKGTDTFAGLQKFLQAQANNPNFNDDQARFYGQQMKDLRVQTFNQIWAQGIKDGTITKDPEGAKKIINARLAPMDMAIDSVFNKDWGSAYSHMNMNKAISADSTNMLYNAPDEDVRKYNRMVGAISEISPQFGKDFFQTSLLGNVPAREKEFLKNAQMELLTQPDSRTGKVASVNQAISNAKAKGATSPQFYDKLMSTVDNLGNPKLAEEHQRNLADAFFNPDQNHGLLGNFEMDHYDPVTKRNVPGRYTMFQKLAGQGVGEAINKLGLRAPDIPVNYQDTMSREFGEQLFSREIKDMAALNRNFQPIEGRGPAFQVKLVDNGKQAPRFSIVDDHGMEVDTPRALAQGLPVQAITRLNSGVAGLWTVYNSTGANANRKVMDTMYKYGYQDANSPVTQAVKSTLIHDALERANASRSQ